MESNPWLLKKDFPLDSWKPPKTLQQSWLEMVWLSLGLWWMHSQDVLNIRAQQQTLLHLINTTLRHQPGLRLETEEEQSRSWEWYLNAQESGTDGT